MSRRFINISTFKHGAVAYTTLQNVEENTEVQEIAASGDADKTDSFLVAGKSSTRGTLSMQDPIQAEALLNATKADITFIGEAETGGVQTKVTIKNVIFFSKRASAVHNGVWGQSLTWRAFDPSGLDAVTMADVTPP